tara:strand:- start:2956 stop:4122 length:1167 start_codon:yes stop_codon:yes gene_type:complete
MSEITITENSILKLLVRRGADLDRKNIILSQGELGYTTDGKRLFVGDGSTLGGKVAGSIFFGVATNTSPYTLTELGVKGNTGDTIYSSVSSIYYVLTGTNAASLSSYLPVGGSNIVKVDNIKVTKSTDGTLSLLPLSAGAFDSKIFTNGLSAIGNTLQLGPAIYITSIDSNAAFNLRSAGVTTLSGPGINLLSTTTNILSSIGNTSITASSISLSSNSLNVNNNTLTFANNSLGEGLLYRQVGTGLISTKTPGSTLTFFSSAIKIFTQGTTTAGGSNTYTLCATTLSGFNAQTMQVYLEGEYNCNQDQAMTGTLNTDAGMGISSPIVLNLFRAPKLGSTLSATGIFEKLAPLSATYLISASAIGSLTVTISSSKAGGFCSLSAIAYSS